MTITFTGHAFVSSYAAVKEKVKQQLRAYVDGARAITFYLGGYGSFDEICAAVCRELKQEYDGAYKAYQYAKHKNKKIINICDEF